MLDKLDQRVGKAVLCGGLRELEFPMRQVNENTRAVVVGYGRIGRLVVHALRLAPDLQLAGIVSRRSSEVGKAVADVPVVSDVELLTSRPDVAILCVPAAVVDDTAHRLLSAGIRTVDACDTHGDAAIVRLNVLDRLAKENASAAIVAAGIDPGINTVIRALMEIWAPTGITYGNFGPGMAMAHTEFAKSHPGVSDALVVTRPVELGKNTRDVYVQLTDGADFAEVQASIAEDQRFAGSYLQFFCVPDVASLADTGHRARIFRKGSASGVDNQVLSFDARFSFPPSVAQVLVGAARAVSRLSPGVYTLLDIPLVYLLPGSRERVVRRCW